MIQRIYHFFQFYVPFLIKKKNSLKRKLGAFKGIDISDAFFSA